MNRKFFYFFIVVMILLVTLITLFLKIKNIDKVSTEPIKLFYLHKAIDQSDNLSVKVNPPSIVGIALVPEYKWESDAIFYSTVSDEGDSVKMWYLCRELKSTNLCYAESLDAIKFNKKLNNNGNNIVNVDITDGGNVFKLNDDIGYGAIVTKKDPKKHKFSQLIYKSKDGIEFDLIHNSLLPYTIDTQNIIFYDKKYMAYIAYIRSWNRIPELTGTDKIYRTVSRIELQNPFYPWDVPYNSKPLDSHPYWYKETPPAISTELQIVMQPDALDPDNTHIYNPGVNLYGDSYVAFPSIYSHFPDPVDGGTRTNDGTTIIELALSLDGINFIRLREPYINHDLLGSDVKSIYMTQGIVHRGDSIYHYALALDNLHQDPFKNPRIITLKQKKNRFAFLMANNDNEGYVVYEGLPNKHVIMNYSIENDGYIVAEILDANGKVISGFSREEMLRLKGDKISSQLIWKKKSLLPRDTAYVKFYFKDAKLFSFELK